MWPHVTILRGHPRCFLVDQPALDPPRQGMGHELTVIGQAHFRQREKKEDQMVLVLKFGTSDIISLYSVLCN